jgi:quercetin dioxygenase-like cupin family protein
VSRPALVAAVAICSALAACRAPRTPEAPRAEAEVSWADRLRDGGPPALQPYLDAYPLGDKPSRVDLLAESAERSLHFVQARKAIANHVHPARTETVYVLTGSGTCYVGDRSYPIRPGATFRIRPGVAHTAIPSDGRTIVALSWFEPPLGDADDRVLVPAH